jgi:hypothetical protein
MWDPVIWNEDLDTNRNKEWSEGRTFFVNCEEEIDIYVLVICSEA